MGMPFRAYLGMFGVCAANLPGLGKFRALGFEGSRASRFVLPDLELRAL